MSTRACSNFMRDITLISHFHSILYPIMEADGSICVRAEHQCNLQVEGALQRQIHYQHTAPAAVQPASPSQPYDSLYGLGRTALTESYSASSAATPLSETSGLRGCTVGPLHVPAAHCPPGAASRDIVRISSFIMDSGPAVGMKRGRAQRSHSFQFGGR